MSIDPKIHIPDLRRRSERVRWARESQTPSMSQRELARRIEVSPRTIQLIENEDGGTKRSRYLDKVAQALNVSFKWLMDGEGGPFEREDSGQIRWLPVMESTEPFSMGQRKPVPAWMLEVFSEESFLFQVQDDAMAPALPQGVWVVCDPAATPAPGKVVLLRETDMMQGTPTLRVWRDRDISVELVPDNRNYASVHMGKFDAAVIVVIASFLAIKGM